MIRLASSVHLRLPLFLATVALATACGSGGLTTGDPQRSAHINDLVQSAGAISVPSSTHSLGAVGDAGTSNYTDSDGTIWQCTQQEYSASVNADTLVAINPNADTLFPGSMLQGKSIVQGELDPVPSKRAGGTVTLAIASSSGINGGTYSADLKEVNLSQVTDAVNNILSNYTGPTAAKFTYNSQVVSSETEVDFAVGAGLPLAAVNLNASLDFSHDNKKSHVIAKLTQEYFTMAFQPPYSASDFFDPSVTDKDLAPYTGNGNPLVYVSGVTYGRLFVYLFSSDEDENTLKAHVDAAFRLGTANVSGSVDVGVTNTLQNSNVQVFALGGNATDAATAATGSVDDLVAFIQKDASFGTDNPGAPISYSMRYVNDSTTVRINMATDYTTNQCVPEKDTADLDLASSSILVNDTCNDGFFSSGCAGLYWTMKAEVLDGSDTVMSFDWASRDASAAAQVCEGKTVTLADEIILHDVPKASTISVRVYGQVWSTKDSSLVGDFTQLHTFHNGTWSGTGDQSTTLNSGQCGSNAAVLHYSFNPID